MPAYVLKCEGCGGHIPFLIHQDELLELEEKNLVEKYCPTCRDATSWVIAFPERRSGRDRRSDLERRAAE